MKMTAAPSSPPDYDRFTGVLTLAVSASLCKSPDPSKCRWSVSFQPDGKLVSAQQEPATSDTFALGSASANIKSEVTVSVRASGIPPPGDSLKNPNYWRVQVSDSAGNSHAIQPVTSVKYEIGFGSVTLKFPVMALDAVDPTKAPLSWTVFYLPPDATLSSTAAEASTGALGQAKGRDDADLYLAGNYIAGVGSKPIWTIDAKAGYSDEPGKLPVLDWFIRSNPPNLRFGIYGEMQTNVDQQPPVDRTQLDPDSILAYTTLFRTSQLRKGSFFYGLKWEIQPVGGEFSRKYSASNLISGGRARFYNVFGGKGRMGLDVIPSIGFEGGKNLNQPGTLFGRPVDLRTYDGIARLRPGADSNLYIFRRAPSPDDTYAFTLTGTWTARVPFTAEPFTTTAYLPELQNPAQITRQQVVSLRKNTRHFVQVDATWNVSQLFGFQVEYKYGALPPLFEFSSHQMSVGVVFKATYNKNHGVTAPLP